MTPFSISEELATTITSAAANRRCSPEVLLQSIFDQMKSAEALAEQMLTPALQERFLRDKERVKNGEFVTEEEVDRKFEAFFQGLAAR